MKRLKSFLLGFSLIALLGLTSDQILNSVYDSATHSLKVKAVAGATGAPWNASTSTLDVTGSASTSTVTSSATNGITINGSGGSACVNLSLGGTVQWRVCTDGVWTDVNSHGINIGSLTYNGPLNIKDVNTRTASATISHRVEVCGAASSGADILTAPASPAVGDTWTVIQRDASHACILSRAGSQTIDNALTSVTITAGVGVGKDCTLFYVGTNDWHASGNCS